MDENQTVTVQYTVKLNELWKEPRRLLEQAFDHIDELPTHRWAPNESVLSNSTLEKIHLLRLDLESADRMLRDASNIVEQYIEFRSASQQSAHSNTGPTVIDLDATPTEAIKAGTMLNEITD